MTLDGLLKKTKHRTTNIRKNMESVKKILIDCSLLNITHNRNNEAEKAERFHSLSNSFVF